MHPRGLTGEAGQGDIRLPDFYRLRARAASGWREEPQTFLHPNATPKRLLSRLGRLPIEPRLQTPGFCPLFASRRFDHTIFPVRYFFPTATSASKPLDSTPGTTDFGYIP